MTCAQTKDQIVDFLYDELAPDVRAAFVQHTDGCPACKAELSSYEKTLGTARAALRGPLSQEPPMRVRLAALQAAEAAKPVPARPQTARKTRATTDEDGFFTRLFRAPWFLPAFGAASVATVVFLVRVLKNPEVLPGQRPSTIDEQSVQLAKPAAAPAAAAERPPASASVHSEGEAKAAKADREALGGAALPAPKGFGDLGPAETRGRGAVTHAKRAASSGLAAVPAGTASRMEASGAAANKDTAPRAHKISAPVFDEPAPPRPAPAPVLAEPPAAPSFNSAPVAATQPRRASPTSAAASAATTAGSAPAGGVAAEAKAVRKRAFVDDSEAMADFVSTKKKSIEPSGEIAPAETSAKAEKSAVRERDQAPSVDDSVRRADRLFARQDWNAAADAYRDLLRRFPAHRDAAKWRERMNAATVAYQQTQQSKRQAPAAAAPAKQ